MQFFRVECHGITSCLYYVAAINEVKAKGYCHFRREQTEEEKELLKRSLTPSRIGDELPEETAAAENTNSTAHSAWNRAGTWEEKNVSSRAKALLKESLKEIKLRDDNVDIQVSSVTNVNGDAQIVMVCWLISLRENTSSLYNPSTNNWFVRLEASVAPCMTCHLM